MNTNSKINKVPAIQVKKKRNVISTKNKMEIIRPYNNGKKAFLIARSMQHPPTMVRPIIKKAAEIRSSATATGLFL